MADNNNGTLPTAAGKERSDYLTIGAFTEKGITALKNALLPDVEPLLAKRGILKADVQTKLLDLQKLQTLNEAQRQEYGDQYKATADFDRARVLADEDYTDHVKLARLALRGDLSAQTSLGLVGKRKLAKGDYILQGLQFYKNALANTGYMTALAKKGITQAELQAGKAAFDNLQTLSAAQQKETGEAQKATVTRDALYDSLVEWMRDFYETAKVALRKYPQLLEKLGLVVKA